MTSTSPNTMTPLELAVLDMLLAGDHPVLASLRAQAATLHVTKREFTDVGFFTDVARPEDVVVPTSGRVRLVLGDVDGTIPGLVHGAGFHLFVEHGAITMLEGFAYDEAWPLSTDGFSLHYWDDKRTATLALLNDEIPPGR